MRWLPVPILLLALACRPSDRSSALRQSTDSYQFDITPPARRPAVGDDVTYVILVRDRETGQPLETGEGRIFARAGIDIIGAFVKAPEVGRYTGTLRFPNSGGWLVSVLFRERSARKPEPVHWTQVVRSTRSSGRPLGLAPPWAWKGPDKK